MILRGLLGRSLGGFTCIRGYAPLRDLIAISKPSQGYQRDLDETHRQALTHFLEKRESQFFPEIILSYNINQIHDNITLVPTTSIIEIQASAKKSVRFSLSANRFTKKGEFRAELNIASIFIANEKIEGLFNRIDGNHRLSAAEHLADNLQEVSTPFCLVLLDDNDKNEKIQSTIFHNINSKGKPLTTEENLKGILDARDKDTNGQIVHRFSDAELERDFGWPYVKARTIIQELDKDYLAALTHVLGEHSRAVILGLVQFLGQHCLLTERTTQKRIKECLSEVNQIYRDEPRLKQCSEKGLFFAMMFYALKGKDDEKSWLKAFRAWVLRSHIDRIQHIDAMSIVDVFNQVHTSEIKIFMAMPYYSDFAVDNYNRALANAIRAIRDQNPNLNLMNHPIMRGTAPTHDMIADIMAKIRGCHIFIADISDNNANVLYEYGVARGAGKACILLCSKSAENRPKSDYANDLHHVFDGDFQLEAQLKLQIESVLKHTGYEVS
jgi:hypothetical protein